jgi:hypothetical protein
MPAHRPSPDRPHLEQKKKLATELLADTRKLNHAQANRFLWNCPRFKGRSTADVLRMAPKLTDAQHVVARESGFESWSKMRQYIEFLEDDPGGPAALFEEAVRAIIGGDVEGLRTLLEKHPELATMQSQRHHRSYLPHYIAANGVENEHQITPPNAVEVARVLFAAGADAVIDRPAGFYGGGGSASALVGLVTSGHPHEAGVQADLVRVFCAAGARVDGIDGDGLPLSMALGFRYPAAAQALAECGARVDNLIGAAALGRLELVHEMLDGRRPSEACELQNPRLCFDRSTAPHPQPLLEQAFVFAAMCGNLASLELLFGGGVDIHAGPRQGITALHEACQRGQLETVQWLLERDADPTRRERQWGATPLGWTNAAQQPEIAEEILRRGRVDILDAIELERWDIVRRLLREDPELANGPEGRGAPLRYAAAKGDLALARLLLDAGGDPRLPNEAGHRAKDYAEKNGHTALVELLEGTNGTPS